MQADFLNVWQEDNVGRRMAVEARDGRGHYSRRSAAQLAVVVHWAGASPASPNGFEQMHDGVPMALTTHVLHEGVVATAEEVPDGLVLGGPCNTVQAGRAGVLVGVQPVRSSPGEKLPPADLHANPDAVPGEIRAQGE